MRRNALRSFPFLIVFAAVALAVRPFPATVQAGTRVVDSLADHGPGSLRRALADSLDGDRIEIAVDGTIALESTLEISRSVTVLGPEMLEGQEPRIRLDGGHRVSVLHVAKGVTVTLEGLIVERGWTDDGRTGGGITNEGSLDVHRCWIRGNEGDYGGGLHNIGRLNLDESRIIDNLAGIGGGIYSTPGDVRVANSVVASNRARNIGGGLYTGRSSHEMLVEKSRVESNTSPNGAGIVGSGWIVDSVIVGNAAGSSGYGGGVTIGFGGILRSAVIDNRAHVGAGVLCGTDSVLSGGDLVVANTTIAANVATSYTASGRDYPAAGGGIAARDSVRIINCTIAENSALGGVGGGLEVGADGGAALLFNTLVSQNVGGNCNEPVDQIGHNLQHPGTDCGQAIPSADPLLGALDRENASPALEPGRGSPAVDAGDALACSSAPVSGVDQRGMARPAGGQPGCDIGAVEAGSLHTPTPGYTPVAAPTEPPDLVPGEYGYYVPLTRDTCHGKQVSGGASVEVENQGPSPSGPFVVEYGGVRQRIDKLGAGSSAILYYAMSWGGWLIADVEDSVKEWFEGNNAVDNVSLIYPTQGPTTPPTAGPSPTPAPTPVVAGRVALEAIGNPSSCAQPLAIRGAFTATSGLGVVTDMRVRLDPYKSCCQPDAPVDELAWQPFEPFQDYQIAGGPRVYLASLTVQFRDDAGRLSPVGCDTVVRPCGPYASPTPRPTWTPSPTSTPSPSPTPQCTADPPSYLELSAVPSVATVGDLITLRVTYHNIGEPYLYLGASPEGLITTDPPLGSVCKYSEHPYGCTAVTFRALAPGVVDIGASATGEVTYCSNGRYVLGYGGGTARAPARVEIGPPPPGYLPIGLRNMQRHALSAVVTGPPGAERGATRERRPWP